MEWEALVMIKDSEVLKGINPDQVYREGDIVVVRPKGWEWGTLEVKEFLIILIDIDDADMVQEEISIEFEVDSTKKVISKSEKSHPGRLHEPKVDHEEEQLPEKQRAVIIRRRFHIDSETLLNQLSREEREKVKNRKIEFQPFRNQKVTPIDKMLSPDVKKKLDDRIEIHLQLGHKNVKWHQKLLIQ